MPTALAISPHLDDAIFSAGGTLARLARGGWRVVVATVFTASVPDPRGFALACQLDKGLAPDVDYMALRRAEDAAACGMIGAEPQWLPFAEAPHRGYRCAADLFAGLRRGDTIVDEITPALSDLVRDLCPDVVFSPQAIGAHVDHVAVHLALRPCAVTRRFWADFPYVARASTRPSPVVEDFGDASVCRIELSRVELAAKVDAATAYSTQLDFQFGGGEKARAMIATLGCVEQYVGACDLPILRKPGP